MAGIEDVVVEWAPTDPPITAPDEPNWETLAAGWQNIKVSQGLTIDNATQTFTVGTATIRVRNGDTAGRTPTFSPTSPYRGRNIRVVDNSGIGPIFRGRIDRVDFDMTKTPFAGFVTLHCVDIIGNVNDIKTANELFGGTVDYFTNVDVMEDAVQIILQLAIQPDAINDAEFSQQLVKAPDAFESTQSLLDLLNDVLLTEGASLYASPLANEVFWRGRWKPFELLGMTDPYTFTDAPADSDPLTFAYRRDDLEFTDADHDILNSAVAKSKYLGVEARTENITAGYPRVQLSHTELVTIRQGWVEANARMWYTLGSYAAGYPKKLKFLVASHGYTAPNILTAYGGVPLPFADLFEIIHTPPGTASPITYRVAVNAIEHDIDRQRWLCGLGFESLDPWWYGYGNGTDEILLVEIDGDADHGIDSDAIIAP